MLWNIENAANKDSLDLVQILSHTPGDSASLGGSKVQGHALTIKDEFIASLVGICKAVCENFLECGPDGAVFAAVETGEKLLVAEEELLVKALDSTAVKSWDDFEFALAVVVENRLLQLYQSHLDKEY